MRWDTVTIHDLIKEHYPDLEVYYYGPPEGDCTVQLIINNQVAIARVFGHCQSAPEDPHDCEVLGILATFVDHEGHHTYQDLRLIADLGILLETHGYTNPYESGWEVDWSLTHPPHHPRTHRGV